MNTLKKLAGLCVLMAGLCSYAQPVPIKISSLVPVTNAQPNALVLLTIPGVTNYVITIANLQMQIGGGSTNFALTAATDLTNLIYIVGANDTNYINSIFTSLSNLINSSGVNLTNLIYLIGANTTNFTYQIGANTTNFVIDTGTSLSNLIYQIGANCTNFTYSIGANMTNFVYQIGANLTNYVDQSASNRVTVAAGPGATVTTNNIGNVMVYTVGAGAAATNYTVVLSGTNTYIEVTTTNNTNFYKVNSTATGGGTVGPSQPWITQITNPPYVTNMVIDLAVTNFPVWRLSSLTNHINISVTNPTVGQTFTVLVDGAAVDGVNATNYGISWNWMGATAYWIGYTTNIVVTSNKIACISGFIPAAGQYIVSGRE